MDVWKYQHSVQDKDADDFSFIKTTYKLEMATENKNWNMMAPSDFAGPLNSKYHIPQTTYVSLPLVEI